MKKNVQVKYEKNTAKDTQTSRLEWVQFQPMESNGDREKWDKEMIGRNDGDREILGAISPYFLGS